MEDIINIGVPRSYVKMFDQRYGNSFYSNRYRLYLANELTIEKNNHLYTTYEDLDRIVDEDFVQIGGDMHLYSDNRPHTTIKGTGYTDAKKAKKSIKLMEKRSILYQKSLINTLYNRAKFHPNITKGMREAMKIFAKWKRDNKNKEIKYDYLDLNTIKKYEKLAEIYGVSEVTRGLKKGKKAEIGFLVAYKKLRSPKKLAYNPVKLSNPSGQDYDSQRETFLNSRLGQIKAANTPLYYKSGRFKDLPTKQHVIMIMRAYSPEPKKIKSKKMFDRLYDVTTKNKN